jgi:hypothetical protein
MNPFVKLILVIGIFSLGFVILLPFVWLVNKYKLLNIRGLLVAASGAGLGFGFSAFILSFLDEKPHNWDILRGLSIGGQIFVWFFIGSIIIIPLSFVFNKLIKSR